MQEVRALSVAVNAFQMVGLFSGRLEFSKVIDTAGYSDNNVVVVLIGYGPFKKSAE